jgi:hypothetical protein
MIQFLIVFIIVFSIKDLVEIINKRQANKFDLIIAITGARGNSKSTFLFKLFSRFKKFDPWKQIVYSRNEVIKLLESEKFGLIFDDEGIQSNYKREFQSHDQQQLIKMLTMYRNNFNIYGVCIPYFYSLDKDLRNLVKVHINMIERGLGVVHVAHDGVLYSDDPWNVAYNKKIEENWIKKKQFNPNFKPPYHKLTTFKGYIKFNDITPEQRNLYEEIKLTKRKEIYDKEQDDKEQEGINIYDNLYAKLKSGEIDKEWIEKFCLVQGLKVTNCITNLGKRARDDGTNLTEVYKISKNLRAIKPESSMSVKQGFRVSDLIKS